MVMGKLSKVYKEVYLKRYFIFLCFLLLLMNVNCKEGRLSSSSNGQEIKEQTQEIKEIPLDQDPSGPKLKNHQFSITQQVIKKRAKLDIVWVIDNSGSMLTNHQNLRNRFRNLFNQGLQSSDWQMAFISSLQGQNFYQLRDNNLPEGTHILSPKYSNFEEIFKNTISSMQFGASSTLELKAIYDMINNHKTKPGFFRADALLAVIVVTDDGDTSPQSPSDIITSVQNNFGASKKFVTYGIIVEPGGENCGEPAENQKVAELVRLTGGVTGSICEEDYSSVMANIGDHIKKELLFNDVLLKHNNVIENSISLTFSPAENETNWQYDSQTNKIVFTTSPTEDTIISISYNYLLPPDINP